jgi:hypothetical protein
MNFGLDEHLCLVFLPVTDHKWAQCRERSSSASPARRTGLN